MTIQVPFTCVQDIINIKYFESQMELALEYLNLKKIEAGKKVFPPSNCAIHYNE